jgi:hypothetical protein
MRCGVPFPLQCQRGTFHTLQVHLQDVHKNRIQEEEYQGGVKKESRRIHDTPTSQNQQQGRVTPTASRKYGQW